MSQVDKPPSLVELAYESALTALIKERGDDPTRTGMLETPARVVKAMREYTAGYAQDPAAILKAFEDGAENYSSMVCQSKIPVSSLCEHHLAPFFGTVAIGYIPKGRVVGLSKLSRLVDVFAKRFQVQERLTQQIADALQEHLCPQGVAVVVECRHMCMEVRGIQRVGTVTTTSALTGAFMREDAARAEFMTFIARQS